MNHPKATAMKNITIASLLTSQKPQELQLQDIEKLMEGIKKTKLELCQENGYDILIEDSFENALGGSSGQHSFNFSLPQEIQRFI